MRIEQNVCMKKMTWLHVGGKAARVFYPRNVEELSDFLTQNIPYKVMGMGSNILVRDGGIKETVIKIGACFNDFTIHDDGTVDAGAGLLDRWVALQCAESGISGFEFLYTIPGNIGGGLSTNAGCYGGEIADRLLHAWVMDPQGKMHIFTKNDLGYGYRFCALPPGWIFLKARFQGVWSSRACILSTMDCCAQQREISQPLRVRTGGSTFANPPGDSAWSLIDRAGYRAAQKGDAQISEKHCNFLINHGNARAADMEDLAEEARNAVWEKFGVKLVWEIVRWGDLV